MNKRDRGILYGMLFGDGNLHLPKGQVTYSFTMGHSPKQGSYLEHKVGLLHSIFGGKRPVVSSYDSRNKQTNKVYTNLQTRKTHNYFNQMHRVVYKTGVKRFTKQALDYLTDQGLALWFADDGSGVVCKNKKGGLCGCMVRIATYCSKEEAEIIKTWFETTYQLSPVFDVDKRNNLYSIRFKTVDSKKFAEIVSPHLPDCMKYKVDQVISYVTRVQDAPPVKTEGEDIV